MKRTTYQILASTLFLVLFFLALQTETAVKGILWFVYGMYNVIWDRVMACGDALCLPPSEWAKQTGLGFGQTVSLFLLSLPVLSFDEP